MANKNQHFAELEYCFGQYFSKYCSPVIAKDYRYYNRKQSEEFNKIYNELPANIGAGSPLQGMIRFQSASVIASSSGEWNKKTIDDFIKGVVGKIVSNKNFQRDWSHIVDQYRESLIGKLGKKGYVKAAEEMGKRQGKEFIDPAAHYGQMRFIELVKEHLARTNMPKSSLEYVFKEALSNQSLLGMISMRVGRGRGLTSTEEELLEIEKKLYKPTHKEEVATWVTGAAVDAAATLGAGTLATAGKTAATNIAFNAAGKHIEKGINHAMGWLGFDDSGKTISKTDYSKIVFGNEQALEKHQKSSLLFRKNGTEYISDVNDDLGKKIKVAPMRPHVSNAVTRKESNQLMQVASGNSKKLLNTITASLNRQAIPFNGHAPIPDWMLRKTSRQCRAFASSFFSIGKQMSVQGLNIANLNGKNMTLVQIAQRASDYARAAVQIDKVNTEKKAARAAAYNRNHPEVRQERRNDYKQEPSAAGRYAVSKPIIGATTPAAGFPNASSSHNMLLASQPSPGIPPQPMPTATPYPDMPQTDGWGKYLDQAGLNGFGDVTKNLGYVFAMLPDMLIGMFTGRTSSFTIGNNIIPLAAIAAGLFSRNPLLKLMLMGLGGANILNNAGHEVLGLSTPKDSPRNYRQYADEPLNPRLSNVFMRGRSLIADIDNRPVVINISDSAVDAYEKKAVPLNTLANAVLRKYDESMAVVSNTYDRNMALEEGMERQQRYGLK